MSKYALLLGCVTAAFIAQHDAERADAGADPWPKGLEQRPEDARQQIEAAKDKRARKAARRAAILKEPRP